MNPAFVGSTDELTSLESFSRSAERHGKRDLLARMNKIMYYVDIVLFSNLSLHNVNIFTPSSRKTANAYLANTENVALEQLDCVDSGINSVETIEFQPLDQEPSFEQSLLQIIDEKLGRGSNNSKEEKNSQEITSSEEERKTTFQRIAQTTSKHETSSTDLEPWKVERLEDTVNTETDFKKLRLEFQNNGADLSSNSETPSKLSAKIDAKLTETPIELKDYKKKWTEFEEISLQENTSRQSFRGPVTLRRNKKPTIVFLHGFGSSAEIFEHQLQYFSSLGYPCIAPDMLGHGMSSAPGRSRDYHFGKLLKDLDAVLQQYAFKPGEKCVLVAHNYG